MHEEDICTTPNIAGETKEELKVQNKPKPLKIHSALNS